MARPSRGRRRRRRAPRRDLAGDIRWPHEARGPDQPRQHLIRLLLRRRGGARRRGSRLEGAAQHQRRAGLCRGARPALERPDVQLEADPLRRRGLHAGGRGPLLGQLRSRWRRPRASASRRPGRGGLERGEQLGLDDAPVRGQDGGGSRALPADAERLLQVHQVGQSEHVGPGRCHGAVRRQAGRGARPASSVLAAASLRSPEEGQEGADEAGADERLHRTSVRRPLTPSGQQHRHRPAGFRAQGGRCLHARPRTDRQRAARRREGRRRCRAATRSG